jgi:hypothetical protein
MSPYRLAMAMRYPRCPFSGVSFVSRLDGRIATVENLT